MKKNYSILFVVLYSAFLSSCNRLLIEPDPKGDAAKNFEVFWSDIYNTYPYFKEDAVDWNATYKKYRPMVINSTNNDVLFDIFSQMLSPLSDGHISLLSADKNKDWENYRYTTYKDQPSQLYFSPINNIKDTYLKNTFGYELEKDKNNPSQENLLTIYGLINSDIIYYYVSTYETDYAFEKKLDSIIQKNSTSKGLILDLRDNGGGSLETMQKFVGMFFNYSFNYAKYREKVGPLDNNYAPFEAYTISPNTSVRSYTDLRIVVLTNRFTVSAAEHTVLALRKRNVNIPNNTTVIGDTTAGAQSFIIQRTLPNGMQYTMVNSQTFDIDGTLYEKVGIPPQEYVPLTGPEYDAGKDDMIDRAIEILNK